MRKGKQKFVAEPGIEPLALESDALSTALRGPALFKQEKKQKFSEIKSVLLANQSDS